MDGITGALEVVGEATESIAPVMETTGSAIAETTEAVGAIPEIANTTETSVIAATGDEPANILDYLNKRDPDETLERLSKADLKKNTPEKALLFREMSEESDEYKELLKKYPEIEAKDSIVNDTPVINEADNEIPKEEDTKMIVFDSKVHEANQEGDKTQEEPLNEKDQERIATLDFLQEHSDILDALSDLKKCTPDQLKNIKKKIEKLIKEEQDEKKISVLEILLAIFMSMIVTTVEETKNAA